MHFIHVKITCTARELRIPTVSTILTARNSVLTLFCVAFGGTGGFEVGLSPGAGLGGCG